MVYFSLFAVSVLAAEPVNEDAELSLELLEFLAEFGNETEQVPVTDDELGDDDPVWVDKDSQTPRKAVEIAPVTTDSKRGKSR
jgi:hypothetical protein